MDVDVEKVWNDVIKDKQKTGEISEYTPEILIAMKIYAGLCINELLDNHKIKCDNLNDYMNIRAKVDKLIYNQV